MAIYLQDVTDLVILHDGKVGTTEDCCCVGGGVCCRCDGSCDNTITQEECELDSGEWFPSGECGDDPCETQTTGACCVDTDCSIKTEICCDDVAGVYKGDDTDCDPNPCDESGACCHLNGSCSITAPDECDGSYQGNGSECATSCGGFGSCCYDIDACHVTCINTTATACATTYSGIFSGNGSTCFYGCECLEHLPCTSCFECTGEDSCFGSTNVRQCCEAGTGCLRCGDGTPCGTLSNCSDTVGCSEPGLCTEVEAIVCACIITTHSSLCGGCPDEDEAW